MSLVTARAHFQAEYLTPAQVGELMSVSAKSVIRMIRRGELHGRMVGGQWRIAVAEYERWTKRD